MPWDGRKLPTWSRGYRSSGRCRDSLWRGAAINSGALNAARVAALRHEQPRGADPRGTLANPKSRARPRGRAASALLFATSVHPRRRRCARRRDGRHRHPAQSECRARGSRPRKFRERGRAAQALGLALRAALLTAHCEALVHSGRVRVAKRQDVSASVPEAALPQSPGHGDIRRHAAGARLAPTRRQPRHCGDDAAHVVRAGTGVAAVRSGRDSPMHSTYVWCRGPLPEGAEAGVS